MNKKGLTFMNNKKGMTIGDLYPIVLTLVLIGILLGIGLYTLSSVHRQISTDYSGVEGLLEANDSSLTSTLANASLTNFYLVPNTITITNASSGLAVTNFTSTTAGVITWGGDLVLAANTTYWNASFTYNYDRTNTAEESVTTSITGVSGFSTWIAIIVVVLAAAVVLGIVLSSFGKTSSA